MEGAYGISKVFQVCDVICFFLPHVNDLFLICLFCASTPFFTALCDPLSSLRRVFYFDNGYLFSPERSGETLLVRAQTFPGVAAIGSGSRRWTFGASPGSCKLGPNDFVAGGPRDEAPPPLC